MRVVFGQLLAGGITLKAMIRRELIDFFFTGSLACSAARIYLVAHDKSGFSAALAREGLHTE
jgi:hypothetical protein